MRHRPRAAPLPPRRSARPRRMPAGCAGQKFRRGRSCAQKLSPIGKPRPRNFSARPHDRGRGARAHRARRMCWGPAGDRRRGRCSSRARTGPRPLPAGPRALRAHDRHRRIAQEGRPGPGSTRDTPRNRARRRRRCSCRAVLMSCSCGARAPRAPAGDRRRCSCRGKLVRGPIAPAPGRAPGAGVIGRQLQPARAGPGPALDRSAGLSSIWEANQPRGPAEQTDIRHIRWRSWARALQTEVGS